MRVSSKMLWGAAVLLASAVVLSAETPFDVFFGADDISAMIAKAKS